MFIKILTPNHNGKIELTVRDLEALIQEAVDKAMREKCAGCSRGYYYGGITYLNTNNNTGVDSTPKWDPYKITCSSESVNNAKIQVNGQTINTSGTSGTTLMDTINDMIGEQTK
jgi:hypothetical protein